MRTLVLLLALSASFLPAFGADRVTVVELAQILAADHWKPDADVAQQLSNLALTERLSADKFAQLEASLPGEEARQALTILADASAFLDPPAAEIPDQPTPDVAAQRKILALAVNYVTQTLQQLPNFFATRLTRSFEDTPAVRLEIGAGDINPKAAYHPIHPVGDSKATVSFRNGHEVLEKTSLDPLVRNLDTAGVFGPILGTVLVDAARSKLTWSHWEKGPSGLQAVFSYAVPKAKSHYTITYDSVPIEPGACNITKRSFSKVVAYHGEMAVDPASGTILRLMLLADLKPAEFTVSSGIEVEFGQVSIGGKDYFLPIRSVTSSLAHSLAVHGAWGHGQGCPGLAVAQGLQKSLNDVVFENYHVFRSDATVLTEDEAKRLQDQPPVAAGGRAGRETDDSAPSVAASTQPAPANAAKTATEPAAIPASSPSSASSAANATSAPTSPAAALVQPAAAAVGAASKIAQTPLYRSTARDVVVDVVVTKGNGDPVLGLTRKDFTVAENGKAQTVDFFEDHTAANTLAASAPPAMPPLPAGAVTNVPPAAPSDAVNVLLLDTLNTGQQDQSYVHRQILEFLTKMRPGTRVAIFLLGSKLRFVQGFTSDTGALLAALKRNGMEPEKNGRSHSDAADDASDISNLQAMQASPYGIEALEKAQGDAAIQDYGERASMTFEALNYLAEYLAGIPGRKNLIWFASSFPVVIFPTVEQRESIEKNPSLPGYLQQVKQTADLFTVSQISVYPISAEGMMTEHILEADSTGPGTAAPTGAPRFGSAQDGPMSNGTMSPFVGGAGARSNAVYAMNQLAASTGGKAFYNTNDLNAAMQRAIDDGTRYYTVGYSPADKTMDGSFRRIDVKVTNGRYKLAYRHGYNADDKPAPAMKSGSNPLVPLLGLGLPGATGVLYGAQTHAGETEEASASNRAGENTALTGALTRYRVDFFIRAEDVDLQPNPQGDRSGKLLIGLKAYDQDGKTVNWEADEETLNVTASEYEAIRRSGIPVHLEIDLPKMEGQLVTAVYDWNSGRAGTLEIPLQ